LDKIVLELIRFNPELIYAYSTGAGRLAEYLIERYGESNPLKPRVVIITCETLFPHHKEAIKAAFRLEGANEYGAAEGGIIAFQCPEGGLHISVDRVMVEIAEPDEKGFGRVVITPLNNQAMVLLRYDLGDRGRLLEGVCACGRTLPLMELAGARVSEMIITSKGAIASSTFFDYMGKSLQPYGLRKFRVIQQSRIHFQIQLAGIESENIALEKRIKKAVQDFLGDDINVAIDYVSEINRDGSGKLRYFIREDFE
jgi:phenylacetate-CoA ligase